MVIVVPGGAVVVSGVRMIVLGGREGTRWGQDPGGRKHGEP